MSQPLLTFIIPVRHQDNAANWRKLKANLSQTIASISSQTHDDWSAIVVANEGADLPELPARFEACRVNYAPNHLYQQGSSSRNEFLDAVRIDKGRRVLAGMLTRRNSRYFMVVDDDDFVSRGLVEHVYRSQGGVGWKVSRGYVWNDGGPLLYKHDDFNHICGTSLIIRSDVYALPDTEMNADQSLVMGMMGSHHGVDGLMEERGTPLTALPFRAAVYRVGQAGSHSGTPGLMKKYVLTQGWRRHPLSLMRKVGQLRLLTPEIRKEFFGG